MAPPSASPLIDHRKGLALSVTGIVLISPDALLIRLVEQAGPWEVAAVRSGFFALSLALFLLLKHGRGALAPLAERRWTPVLATVLFALTNLGFAGALTQTAASNALLIIATVPLWGGLFGWLILGEQVAKRTMAAIGLALCGTATIVAGNLGAGGTLGDAIALGTALTLGLNLVVVRKAGGSILPMMAAGAALASSIAALMVLATGGFEAAPRDVALMATNGSIVQALALGLYFAGVRYLPAAEVGLIVLIEAMLGPLWVWLVLAEVPTGNTFLGGSLVLLAIAGNAGLALAQERRRRRSIQVELVPSKSALE